MNIFSVAGIGGCAGGNGDSGQGYMTSKNNYLMVAEREGFEPPVRLPAQQISSLPP